MKIYTLKVLLFATSFLISVVSMFFCIETGFRIQKKGIAGGLKSYFTHEAPYSVLGVSNWIISDSDLGYRRNPYQPGVNDFSMNEKPITLPKPLGLKRIVILGDSIPDGENNFVDLLKQQFNQNDTIEILNASTPGYTTNQELLFLKKFLLQTQPDIIVLSYCLNDNYEFLHQFDEQANILFTDEAKQYLRINDTFDKLISKSYFLSNLKLTFKSLEKQSDEDKSIFWWDNSVDFKIAWKDYSWPPFEDHLRTMKELLEKQNATLLVVIFPLETQLDPFLLRENPQYVLKPQKQIARISKLYSIPYLDLYSYFYDAKNLQGSNLYSDGIHLTKEGHELSAKIIYTFLNQNL